MSDLAIAAAAALRRHGLPVNLARSVQLTQVPGLNGTSASVTLGYLKDGRRKVVAESLLGSIDDALEMLGDEDRIGSFLASGLRAIPAASRPEAPAWVLANDDAQVMQSLRGKARNLADQAMREQAAEPAVR